MKKTINLIVLLSVLLWSALFILEPKSSVDSFISLGGNPRASDEISPANVTISKVAVKRGIETVTIAFNNTAGLTWDRYKANITLSDDTQFNLTLTNASNVWSADFTPSITNATGPAKITILAVDENDIIQNSAPITVDKTITILNNIPTIGVKMNATELYRGDALMVNFTPSDVEENVLALKWHVAVYKSPSTLKQVLIANETKFGAVYSIPLSHDVGDFYINATVWDSETRQVIKTEFNIKNNYPVFDVVQFKVDTTNFTLSASNTIEIYRGKPTTLYVNASDKDGLAQNLRLSISGMDPVTTNQLFSGATYTNVQPNNLQWNFTVNITFPLTMNLGIVKMTLKIFESNNTVALEEITQNFLVKNNAPVITKCYINGKWAEQIAVTEGDWLNFTFDVSDDENQIRSVKIAIQNTQTGEYFNHSHAYAGVGSFLQIRALDLGIGDYLVYVYVYDENGAMATLPDGTPITFSINPTAAILPTMWLMLIIGIVFGGVVAFAITYLQMRKKGSFQPEMTTGRPVAEKSSKKVEKSENTPPVDVENDLDEENTEAGESTSPEPAEPRSGETKKKVIRKL